MLESILGLARFVREKTAPPKAPRPAYNPDSYKRRDRPQVDITAAASGAGVTGFEVVT